MPVLLLLLTMMTASAVPQSVHPLLMGARAGDVPLGTTTECRVRMGSGGVPVVRVEVAPGIEAWFILDTAATGTTMHPDLAKRLHLPMSGQTTITTVEGSVSAPTVRLQALRLDGLSLAHDLVVAVHDLRAVREAVPDADGILGHDVLSRYDYMVDHTRQRLVIGRFGPPAHGVRLPLTWSAGRPVVTVSSRTGRSGLVLDTGSDVLVMEASAARLTLGDAIPAARSRAHLRSHTGTTAVDVEHHVGLRLANVELPPLALVRLPSDAWELAPEVGLLPASLFGRVYVSARLGEAVVWQR